MPLNIQTPGKGNMYEFINATWNPIGGKCPHECTYCSTNKFYYPCLVKKYSGPPRLIESELKTNLGKNNFIFAVAQGDLFSKDIPEEWIKKILTHCGKFEENKYLFQSKNPEGMRRILPYNSVVCTTLESNRYYPEFMGKSPTPKERVEGMIKTRHRRYVTLEPLAEFDLKEFVEMIKSIEPEMVNIGLNSYKSIKLPEPPKEKILELIDELKKFTSINKKSNLLRALK